MSFDDPAETGDAIDMRGVVKRFGDRSAVDGLTLAVRRGEVFGLLGPNGSGKTTTVNMLTGLTHLTEGSIYVLGHDVSIRAKLIRRRLGAVPQETSLYEELTAVHNLRLHADLYLMPRRTQEARIDEMLDLVQLSERKGSRVRSFSGGMKRRLALARALLHDPDLVILDEPTLGVDVQSRQALWDYILNLRAVGKTVLITTNYLEEADALCDRLAIMDHGRLVALDTPAALRAQFGSSRLTVTTSHVPGPRLIAYLESLPGVTGVVTADDQMTFTLAGDGRTGGHCLAAVAQSGTSHSQDFRIVSVEYSHPSLDDIFLALTGRALRD